MEKMPDIIQITRDMLTDPVFCKKIFDSILKIFQLVQYTIKTPLGDTNIPLPMMDPTMTVTPFNRVILAFSSIFSSPPPPPFLLVGSISISSILETALYSSVLEGIVLEFESLKDESLL